MEHDLLDLQLQSDSMYRREWVVETRLKNLVHVCELASRRTAGDHATPRAASDASDVEVDTENLQEEVNTEIIADEVSNSSSKQYKEPTFSSMHELAHVLAANDKRAVRSHGFYAQLGGQQTHFLR